MGTMERATASEYVRKTVETLSLVTFCVWTCLRSLLQNAVVSCLFVY